MTAPTQETDGGREGLNAEPERTTLTHDRQKHLLVEGKRASRLGQYKESCSERSPFTRASAAHAGLALGASTVLNIFGDHAQFHISPCPSAASAWSNIVQLMPNGSPDVNFHRRIKAELPTAAVN